MERGFKGGGWRLAMLDLLAGQSPIGHAVLAAEGLDLWKAVISTEN
jgi:hypothetical protein